MIARLPARTHGSPHVPLVSSALAASLPVSTHVSSHTLSFSFNGPQYVGVLAHISDYPEGEDRVTV